MLICLLMSALSAIIIFRWLVTYSIIFFQLIPGTFWFSLKIIIGVVFLLLLEQHYHDIDMIN
jgi:hypothetical protein